MELAAEPATDVAQLFARCRVLDRDRGEHQHVGPTQDALPVALGHAHQPADGRQRHAHRQVRDEVDRFAVGGLGSFDEVGDEARRQIGEVCFEPTHRRRREAAHRQHPQIEVLVPIEEDHVGRRLRVPAVALELPLLEALDRGHRLVGVYAQDRSTVDEHVAMGVHGAHVVVACHRPERRDARSLVEVDRGIVPQRIPRLPRIAARDVKVGVRDVELIEHRHHRSDCHGILQPESLPTP